MNFKTIFAIVGLSTIALGKAVDTSYETIQTAHGLAPKELMGLFDYEVGDEWGAYMNRRTCNENYYDKFCVNGDVKGMKKKISMEGKSPEEMCQIIKDTCDLIGYYYNPLTGKGISVATLKTFENGDKIPTEFLSSFTYHPDNKNREEVQIEVNFSYKYLSHYYGYLCGDSMFESIDKSYAKNVNEEFSSYEQEDICRIIRDTYDMISFSYNPLTGEGYKYEKLRTPSGEDVPKELIGLFDYKIGDDMGVNINYKTCVVGNYNEYCSESMNGKIDKSKYKAMKKKFNMGGKSQEEMCKIIAETCEMINYNYNPSTGEARSFATLDTRYGTVPEELMPLFKYSIDDTKTIKNNIKTCKKALKKCTDEESCQIIKETCDMIDYNYNPLTGEGKDLSYFVKK